MVDCQNYGSLCSAYMPEAILYWDPKTQRRGPNPKNPRAVQLASLLQVLQPLIEDFNVPPSRFPSA